VTARSADRCPGVLRLHQAEDGGLARVRVPGGRIPASGLRAVADLARRHGNGIVEITARASLQIRGLAAGAPAAELLMSAGLLPSVSHERVRNILASPVAGRHPRSIAAVDDLVTELDHELCAEPSLAELSGRFLFAVDDGSGLLGHAADVTLVAVERNRFAVGNDVVLRGAAVASALKLARASVRNDLWASDPPQRWLRRSESRLELGVTAQNDGRVAVTAMPPLARLDPDQLDAVAALAPEVRLSAWRTLTFVDGDPAQAGDALRYLRQIGLVTDPNSGWFGLTACAGKGACAKARFDVRAEAERRAALREAAGGGSGLPAEHWAGCERHCGRPNGVEVFSR
jgi:precorrin-3B synthase